MKKGEIISPRFGSFVFMNIDDVRNAKGEKIEVSDVENICRCGKTSRAPYCDGSHVEAEFESVKHKDRTPEKTISYEGKSITINFNMGVCAHIGECTSGLPEVFNLTKSPWIDPDGSSVEKIIETIKKCPSGALSYTIDGVDYKEFGQENEYVVIHRNGPIEVKGGILLKAYDESEPECAEHYTLCKCGKSKNKPFCDGSHQHD